MERQVVNNNSYNLIVGLAESLKAYHTYQKYGQDGNNELWSQLSANIKENALLLQQEVRHVMGIDDLGWQEWMNSDYKNTASASQTAMSHDRTTHEKSDQRAPGTNSSPSGSGESVGIERP